MTDIPALLVLARTTLEGAGVRYATIGGCARNAYAEVRATKDVDFVVESDAESYVRIQHGLAGRSFARATMVKEPGDPLPDFEAFRDPSGRRIDLLFAKTDFERSALTRAEAGSPYAGIDLLVVSPEDLLVYKLLAGRTQDWSDAEAVARTLAIAGRALDWAYVERWCTEWEVADRCVELQKRIA